MVLCFLCGIILNNRLMKKLMTLAGALMVAFAAQAQTAAMDTVVELTELEIVSSRSDSKSPFAVTNLPKKDIVNRLASRDLPNVLNTAPSIYSTNQGGGAGDSRLNVRGFNQRNVAIMINGVPVNDMENGWVYWSNWDGVGDATSNIQVQRGLSGVNLAVPSIGGTINIISDPAARSKGGYIRQELGSWNFLKTTVGFNSGMIGEKLAISGTLVRKTGDGFYQGTWTDAYAYYFGASYQAELELVPHDQRQHAFGQHLLLLWWFWWRIWNDGFCKELFRFGICA
ncbi:MAG: hypothetical protein EBZ16_08040 [Flavobacteriia bacterium]|nr:hypothetical protein [Flavobacteriia bacterium]